MCRPAVFLDRDGVLCRSTVINGKAYAPRRLKDFKLMPYAGESVRKLQDFGYLVIVVTNQPDIGCGRISADAVAAMHRHLRAETAIDDIFICPHPQDDACDCRKPRPGMLLEAARKHHISLGESFMVGDRHSDVEAGHHAGCRTIFIDRAYVEPAPNSQEATVPSLRAAARYICSHFRVKR